MTLEQAIEKYGPIVDGKWAQESKWCVNLTVPPGLQWVKTATGNLVEHIYCNVDIAIPLNRSLQNVIDRKLGSQLKTFDGCYMIRPIRGQPETISTHAWALSLDVNAATNPLSFEGDLSDELAKCFTDEGFVWGKTFHRKDAQHFQFANW